MPIYEYVCSNCNSKFELLRRFSQASEAASCPRCHQSAKRVLSIFACFSTDKSGVPSPVGGDPCASCGATLVATFETPAPPLPSKYAGFWIRFGATIIDGVIIFFISFVLSYFLLVRIVGYRASFLSPIFCFPLYWLYYWLFIGLRGQTPGKMVVGIKVVDARGDRVGLGVAALREILGKTLSAIALYIGFLWIAFDYNKQGWHDKIASTYVVKVEKR